VFGQVDERKQQEKNMSDIIVEGAQCECMFGQSKCQLLVTSNMTNKVKGKKIATILDFAPGINLSSFGTCKSPANPAYVASQSVGGPPPPCIPVTVAPWSPGASKTTLRKIPVLIKDSCASCAFAAVPQSISIVKPNQADMTTK
jgi:hypothetical protein